MSLLRCAVIGVGYLGRFHAQKYKAIEGVELVGVCDMNFEQAQKVAQELGVKAFARPQELIGKVDAVTIASTTSAHFELAKMFLENKVHVNVEKPITVRSSEGEELCRIAHKNNLKLQVGHIERFNKAFKALLLKVKDPLYMECRRLGPFKARGADVSVVHDVMIHDLDLVLAIAKALPQNVQATGGKIVQQTYDFAQIGLEFNSGFKACVIGSRVDNKSERVIELYQKESFLRVDLGTGDIYMSEKPETPQGELKITQWSEGKTDGLLIETQSFVDSIRNNKPCEITGEDGVTALKLVERVIDCIDKRH